MPSGSRRSSVPDCRVAPPSPESGPLLSPDRRRWRFRRRPRGWSRRLPARSCRLRHHPRCFRSCHPRRFRSPLQGWTIRSRNRLSSVRRLFRASRPHPLCGRARWRLCHRGRRCLTQTGPLGLRCARRVPAPARSRCVASRCRAQRPDPGSRLPGWGCWWRLRRPDPIAGRSRLLPRSSRCPSARRPRKPGSRCGGHGRSLRLLLRLRPPAL